MPHLDPDKFDHVLMHSQTAHSIARDLKPVGFSYAVYSVAQGTPGFLGQNAYGTATPAGAAMTGGSRKECDSMSKTITGLSMMHQISLVPEVEKAYVAFRAAGPAERDAKHQTWLDRVHHWLHRPIAAYVPGVSGDGTDWSAFPAASTVTIKDLLCHTSGLSLEPKGNSFTVGASGDDWATIQDNLANWTPAKHHAAQSSTGLFYSNTNFALLRYVLPFFNLIAVNGLSGVDAHHTITGTWDERDHGIGRLYRDLTRAALFTDLAEPLPDVEAHADDVWYFSADKSDSWDISHSVGDWFVVSGAWGWKLTARQYAHAIAGVVSGKSTPRAYWDVVTGLVNSTSAKYAFGIGLAWSAHPDIGPFYCHNGGDGSGRAAGGGIWYEWDDKVFVFFQNSPFSGHFGVQADGTTDLSGDFLFHAFDDALAASLT